MRMRSKSFGERIADVLIEDGLLLPNQLEEAIAIQKSEGGRLLKILTDRQFVTDQGRILPRKYTGLPAHYQRRLNRAIKRARQMLLMK